MTDSYAASELQRLLVAGPHPDEDFFRLKVTGNGSTKWVNISLQQLAAIHQLLTTDPEPHPETAR